MVKEGCSQEAFKEGNFSGERLVLTSKISLDKWIIFSKRIHGGNATGGRFVYNFNWGNDFTR